MSKDKCGSCFGDILDPIETVPTCATCKTSFHFDFCSFNTQSSWKKRGAAQQLAWVCQICNPTKRLANSNVNFSLSQKTPTNQNANASDAPDSTPGSKKRCWDAIITSPPPQFTDLNSKCDYVMDLVINLTDRTNLVLEQLQRSRSDIEDLKIQAKASDERIEKLEQTVQLLLDENAELKYKNRSAEDYSRAENLILHGVSKTKSDTEAMDVVIAAAKLAEVPVTRQDIIACHTLPSRQPGDGKIVCRFVNRWLRNRVHRSVNKTSITSVDLNIPGEKKDVFVTDHLSPATAQLYAEARRTLFAKSGGQFQYVQIRSRKIMLRTTKDAEPIELKSMGHLYALQDQQSQDMEGVQTS